MDSLGGYRLGGDNSARRRLEQLIADGLREPANNIAVDEIRKERNWQAIQADLRAPVSASRWSSRRGRQTWVRSSAWAAVVAIVAGGSGYVAVNHHFGAVVDQNVTTPKSNHDRLSTTTTPSGNLSFATAMPPWKGPVPPSNSTLTSLPVPMNLTPGNQISNALPFSSVSPDGQWIIVPPSDGATVSMLESADGQTVEPVASDGDVIYGETPFGDLIIGGSAGGGGVMTLFNPKTQQSQPILRGTDPNAKWAYRAAESNNGHWVTSVSNFSGAGPGKRTWDDVDGKPVTALYGSLQFAWSPNGRTLAAIVEPPDSGGVVSVGTKSTEQLVLVQASDGGTAAQSTVVVSIPLVMTQDMMQNSFTLTGGPVWSSTGRYVLFSIWHTLYIYDTTTGQLTHLSGLKTNQWGWLGGTQIYASTQSDQSLNFYSISGHDDVQLLSGWNQQAPITAVQPLGGDQLLVSTSDPNGSTSASLGIHYLHVQPNSLSDVYLVPSAFTGWWYDGQNRTLYFETPGSSSTISSVEVPVTLQRFATYSGPSSNSSTSLSAGNLSDSTSGGSAS